MARRLKTIAKEIKETFPEYSVRVTEERMNTDGKAGRLRIPRKGLLGNRLRVYNAKCRAVLSYHTREYYRTNKDVEEWLQQEKKRLGIEEE